MVWSTKKTDGGAAFPLATGWVVEDGFTLVREREPGMTLRDYFAIEALKPVLGSLHGTLVSEEAPGDFLRYSRAAYAIADAMLAAREE